MMAKATSARGLFRATGKTAKAVAVRDLLGGIQKVQEVARETDDFYPTPVDATQAILRAEAKMLQQFDVIWEPAAGDGAMVRELERAGHAVFASDLVDRGQGYEIKSFYEYRESPAKAAVTNPPFKECSRDPGMVRFMLEELGLTYLALLLPLNWLGAEGRMKLWCDHTPARVYVMRWRVDFTGMGAQPATFGWFVWDRKTTNDVCELRTLVRGNGLPDLFGGQP